MELQKIGTRPRHARRDDRRAMLPLLAKAGVKFLHIGVNEASSPPDVPPIFVWKDAATDSDIIVMYHSSYGDVTVIPSQ